MHATGTYFDGQSAQARTVALEHGENGCLRVTGEELALEILLLRIRASDRLGDVPRFLYLPGEAVIETPDNAFVDALLRTRPEHRGARLIHWLESQQRIAAAACLVLVLALAGLGFYAPPLLARALARRVPAEIDQRIGHAALATLRPYFQASALGAEERGRVEAQLRRLRPDVNQRPRVEFLAMNAGLPNAFALPGNLIVVTDALVRLPASDDELAAVLAHEIGHLEKRHGLQSLLRSSTAVLLVAAVTGDLGALTSFASTIPLTLLTAGYARDLEREADAFALALLRARGIAPRAFSTVLVKLDAAYASRPRNSMYLSTHPATEERTALFGAIGAAERGAVLAEPSIEKGRAAAAQGKHREAVAEFDRACAHTRSVALLRLRAKSYFEIADYTHAEADLAEALALEPESAATLAARAELLALGRQKPDEAIAAAQAALRLEPKNATALVALGFAETSRGELAAALQHLDAAVWAAPGDARALAYRGEVRRRREDIRGALADYDRALELNPHIEWVRLARAFCRNREENFAGALADFDLVFTPGLRTVQYHYERARAYHGLGQFERAIAEFTSGERKAKANDERQQLHFSRGLTYFSASNFRAAVADLTAAIDLAPAQPEAYLRRAAAYRALGEPERAFADLERARSHGASDDALRFERGGTLWGLGRAEEAVRELDPLLAAGGAPAAAWRARGLAHFSLQHWAAAEADFTAYMREARGNTEYARFFRLLCRRRGGRDDEAAVFAATVGGWKQGWPKAVGRYLAAEIDESQLLAQTLLGDQPPAAERRCEAYFYIAETLLARGETAGARDFFEKCIGTGVSGYVEYTLARAELQRLEKR